MVSQADRHKGSTSVFFFFPVMTLTQDMLFVSWKSFIFHKNDIYFMTDLFACPTTIVFHISHVIKAPIL